jgi:hypothetical protein
MLAGAARRSKSQEPKTEEKNCADLRNLSEQMDPAAETKVGSNRNRTEAEDTT